MYARASELEMYAQLNRVLALNDQQNNERVISENKEADLLLLMVEKFFYWNPYFDFRGEEELGECNWSDDVTTKLSCTPTGTLATHSIRFYSITQ